MNSRVVKFLSYYKPYLGLLWRDLACALFASVIALTIPLCIRFITKNILEAQAHDALTQIYLMGALLLVLVLLYTACHAFTDYQGHVMGARMEADMRSELFEHYQKLSFGFYDERRTGELMTRLSNDTFHLSELFHHGPEDIIICLLNFLGASIILLCINVKLTLIVLSLMPVMALYGYYCSAHMQKALRTCNDRVGDINTQVEDTLAGIRVVKSFANEEVEKAKFAHANRRFVEARKLGYKSEAFFYDGLVMFTQLMTLAVVIFGAVSIVKGGLDLADLITFLLYIAILIEPIQSLGNFIRLYQEGMAGFARFMDILEVKPDIKEGSHAHQLGRVDGAIEFRNVCFKYKEEYDHVLKNIFLDISPGEYVALVGPSGVGKTTLCSLIPRFYELSAGEILLDGRNIQTISLQSLRKNIGIVQQEVYLFAGSVSDNIRYGKRDASEEEVIMAAKKAHAHEFIMAFPRGYETDIGQRGVKLSGGQKQRLSIARAFLKDAPILIFDEATSALDNESEKAVQDSLEQLIANRTTIVIAHRLSTVKHAQRILVLTEKGIEEQGTHQELIAANGVYASLYSMSLRI